jgi:hypothetical protein
MEAPANARAQHTGMWSRRTYAQKHVTPHATGENDLIDDAHERLTTTASETLAV